MDKNKINELYKRFDSARSEFDKASRALATALNTPDNCKVIAKKTRSAFRKGRNSVKSADLFDERMVYDLFNMLMILDILDGTYEDPAEEVEIYEEEIVEAPVEIVEEVEIYEEEIVEAPFEIVEEVVEEVVEPTPPISTYVAPEPVVETPVYEESTKSYDTLYSSLESSYESSSSSYDDSSSSYDSGGSDFD